MHCPGSNLRLGVQAELQQSLNSRLIILLYGKISQGSRGERPALLFKSVSLGGVNIENFRPKGDRGWIFRQSQDFQKPVDFDGLSVWITKHGQPAR
jgi:hypothetical protein